MLEELTPFVRKHRDELDEADRISPALLPFEVGNVLWRKVRRGELAGQERTALIRDLAALDQQYDPAPGRDVQLEIARLADRHGLTVYDAAYLELALRLGAVLATLDGDLADAARAESVEVRSP